ncbi:MAG: hypothetical protein CMJ89_07385 [Planctomycetes bacterium]|jgi:serine/threonine protein kinase|nr:hypothetical protein [Planctomycetota bacterium]
MGSSMAFMGLFMLAFTAGCLYIAFKGFQGIVWVLVKVFRGIRIVLGAAFSLLGRLLGHCGGFARSMLVDGLHTAGALITAIAILPLALGNLLIGRWSSARHYGAALEDEAASVGLGLYRLAIGHPFRLIGLTRLVQGLEKRLPEIIDRAPRRKAAKGEFPGYEVLGSLPSGGSGAQLYVARPLAETLERFRIQRRGMADEVVIKSFTLEQGSTLPQIVRESRALEAAGKLGLVYEHRLSPERFYYVMPFVKGKELDREIHRLHARSSPDGLGTADLSLATGYAVDLLAALERFHSGGLWHKDVKPANLIVAEGRVHLVDFGLVTPLASALTLTTHGTEYYRDPEMVRLALQGVKVHEVDGVRFDIYSAGAVLFSVVENSFPAHGSLSKITKRCPEALRWIVRRAMAEMRTRYGSAREMREDLLFVARSADPFAVRPADLPSFTGASVPGAELQEEPYFVAPPSPFGPRDSRSYLRVAQEESDGWSARRQQRGEGRRRSWPARLAAAAVILALVSAGSLILRAEHFRSESRRQVQSAPMALTHPASRTGESLAANQRDFSGMRLSDEEKADMKLARIATETVRIDDPFLAELEERVRGFLDGVERETQALDSRAELVSHETPGSGRVLVLRDLDSDLEAVEIQNLQEHLSAQGFRVLEDTELEARVRHLIGLSSFDDELTHSELRKFLADQDELAAIVLVEGSADGERSYCTVGP